MNKIFMILVVLMLCVSPCWAGLNFDGVDDFSSAGDKDILAGATAFTISAWVKFNSISSDYDGIISEWASNKYQFFFGKSDGDELFAGHGNGGSGNTGSFSNNVDFVAGTWYHVLIRCTGGGDSSNYDFFVDGSQTAETGQYGSAYTIGDGSGNLKIGNDDLSNDLNGVASEVAVWNVSLDTNEISLLANSGVKRMPLQVQYSNLVGYWALDDEPDGSSGDGDTFLDLSSNRNDSTGDNGGNNTGCTSVAESVLSYP